ncbi:probable L-type lectin-domain containing receptor kinase S.7 [Magnolia sinica]|uniref:probable L-type lectin-domain containing receptor kinase S.7 n=1 Tax=Magnolia sinica TaxID=86752 RepID=UPI00265B1597|nr:probable L-type lectin-domain containing receptor kinase S.7 [Magnolia sinica]
MMVPLPLRILLLFSLFTVFNLSFPLPASAKNQSFDFPLFNLRNFTLLGDSYLRNGAVGLTRELSVPTSSAGTIIYNTPITFFDPETNISASFSTKFSFTISNVNPESYGDGLTFFLSTDNVTLGSPGSYLGLFNSSNPTKNKIIAIEFDTRLDSQFNDPNSNHIGLDVGSQGLISIKTADANLSGIDLKSGNLITAWIDYKNDQKRLMVWLSYSSFKPEKPLLSVKFNLSKDFNDIMYAGFSGSTEGSTELHLIEEWSFRTFGFRPSNSQSQPRNVSDSSGRIIPVTPVVPASNSTHKFHRTLALGLGITGGLIVFCAILIVFGWVSAKKWKPIRTGKSFRSEIMKGPRPFTYRILRDSTKGFHSSRILGHGAFGTVYKAVLLESGLTFAVKRSKHTHNSKTEFLAELSTIACLRHKNLVQLEGWCSEKGELLLVYEYMPNGSLDKVLYEESEAGTTLKWAHRYKIVVGIASVLMYLHEECEQQVIHRDIKTSNIMLDANLNARLGDFGLARLTDHNKSPVSTLTAGTMGYLAPEYLQYGKATEKTDVFSFGVVMLEVACGRRPIEKDARSQKINLVDWVWGLYAEDRIIEAADSRLKGEFENEEMRRLLLVGLSCVNPDCTKRPTMRRVLQILNKEAELQVVPKRKPSLTFSCSLPLSIEDIVSDCEESMKASPLYELKVL